MALLQPWDDFDLFPVLKTKINNIVTALNILGGGAIGEVPIKASANNFDYVYVKGVSVYQITIPWNMVTTPLLTGTLPIVGSVDTKQQFLNNILSLEAKIYKTAITDVSCEPLRSTNQASPPVANGCVLNISADPLVNSINFQLFRSATGVFNAPAYSTAIVEVKIIKIGK